MEEKFKNVVLLLVFLIGSFGGASSLVDTLEHFNFPSFLSTAIALIYWCAFGMMLSKVDLREDKKSNYDRGYADGYAEGHEEGLFLGMSAANKASKDKFDEGYEAGRADGWDCGYSAAQRDMQN